MNKEHYRQRSIQRNAEMREASRLKAAAGVNRNAIGKPSPQDLAARLAEIPADTRSFTARTFGDPLPGRSALDKILQSAA